MKRSNWMPNNCPVITRTADGVNVGRCWYYMKDTKTCPTHGLVIDEEEMADRLSASSPNLQNIPVHTKIGNKIRKALGK